MLLEIDFSSVLRDGQRAEGEIRGGTMSLLTPQSLALLDCRGDNEDCSSHTNSVLAWSICHLHNRRGVRWIHHERA